MKTVLRTRPGKRIYLGLADSAFGKVLASLLAEWDYRVLERPEADGVALIEEGMEAPAQSEVILLGRSGYHGRDRLLLPVSLEDLWSCLERRFHKPPRNHIRMAMDQPATVGCRESRLPTTVLSLSDLGARFRIGQELAEGERIRVDLDLDRGWQLAGRVIYCLCRGEGTDREAWEIGAIFDRLEAEERRELRQELIVRYLDRVRRTLSDDEFCAGLAGFNIAGPVLRRLDCS